jgi:hypothetical protein
MHGIHTAGKSDIASKFFTSHWLVQKWMVSHLGLHRRYAFASVVIALLIIPNVTSGQANDSSSSTSSESSPSSCLVEVPYNATITYTGVGSGDEVKFTNGTTVSYPLTSCIRAVYPDAYAIALNITANPKFIAMENGSRYSIEEYSYKGNFFYVSSQTCTTTSRSGVGIVNPPECLSSTIVVFDTWSNASHTCCGYIIPYTQTGQIDVLIPFNATGGPELSNLTVIKSDDIGNLCLCTTTSTDTGTISNATTLTSVVRTNCTTVASPPSVSTSTNSGEAILRSVYDLLLVIAVATIVGAAVIYRLTRAKPREVIQPPPS